jgi:hypothetical protein
MTTDIDLSYNVSYSFYVVAKSGNSYSEHSNTEVGTTLTLAAPVLLSIFSCRSVTLTWSEAAVDCFTITEYNIKQTQGSTETYYTVSAPATTYAINDLSYNTQYDFAVQAYISQDIFSNYSTTESGSTLQLAAPSITSLNASCQSITLNWTELAADCFNVLYYYIYQTGNSTATYTVSAPATTYAIGDLSYNEPYDFAVQAYISQDISSNYSDPETGSILQLNAPILLAPVFSCHSVTLTWTQPTDTPSCFTINNYVIIQTQGSIETTYQVFGSVYSTDIPDLSYNTQYEFAVRAYESDTVQSADSNIESGSTLQLPVPVLDTPSVSCNNVTLSWTETADACFGVISYNIQQQIGASIIPYPNVTSPYTINGLAYGSTYYFTIQAYTSSGISTAYSTPVSANTVSTPTPPYAPQLTALLITKVDDTNETVKLTWTDVNNDPASCFPVSSYYIYENGTYIATVAYPTLTYTTSNLSNSQIYSFSVRAYSQNSGLTSVDSNILSTAFWYLDTTTATLKCGCNIFAPKITTQTTMSTYAGQPLDAWSVSNNTFTSKYNIVVHKATITTDTTSVSNTNNYWYFTDSSETSIYANYPITALSIDT